jgi:hypothetical protein
MMSDIIRKFSDKNLYMGKKESRNEKVRAKQTEWNVEVEKLKAEADAEKHRTTIESRMREMSADIQKLRVAAAKEEARFK